MCLKELILSQVKQSVTLGALFEALTYSHDLQYLDISGNTFNSVAVSNFATFIQGTQTLEYLNISYCELRGMIAELVIEALMLNQSLRYFTLNNNKFN